jgi:hypothetical protein
MATEITAATTEETVERNRRKERVGLVTSNKMDKTITVVVEPLIAGFSRHDLLLTINKLLFQKNNKFFWIRNS